MMEDLPLALDQAGAYIEETGCGLSDYRAHYERQRGAMLVRRGRLAADRFTSVVTTFELSCQRAR